jgi:hypothetical protein
MKGRRPAKEIALTSDPPWRAVVAEGLKEFTWRQGAPCDNAAMLPEALEWLATRPSQEIFAALDGFDVSRATRQGAVRLSTECVAKADALCARLSKELPPDRRPPSLRWLVLTALALYAAHLRDTAAHHFPLRS